MNNGIAVFCLLILAAAGWVAVREAGPILAERGNDARLARVMDIGMPVGLSVSVARAANEDCLWAIRAPFARLQSADRRDRVLTACGRVAERSQAEHPALSEGYYLGALVAAEAADVTTMNAMLLAARDRALMSQAMARQRVALAEDHLDSLSPAARKAETEDLALLLTSQPGLAFLVPRYVADASFRRRLRPLVDAAPVIHRQRFMSMLGHTTEASPE